MLPSILAIDKINRQNLKETPHMKPIFKMLFAICSMMLVAILPAMADPQDAPLPRCEGPAGSPPGKASFEDIPPYLKGIALSEAQQDKIFAILHAQVPGMRENEKQKRKTFDALSALTQADTLDEKQLQQLAEKLGMLTKEATLNRTLTEYKIFSLLTPEQRSKAIELKKHRPDFSPHEHHGDPVIFKQPRDTLLQKPIAM
jgi:Spy/CpxP family protein refolding chaperone